MRKIGSEYYKQVKGTGKDEILALCEELMQTGLMEETIIACDWSNRLHRHRATMPRTALRYAIEKMLGEMKAEIMKK